VVDVGRHPSSRATTSGMVDNGLFLVGLTLPAVADGAEVVECRNGLEAEGVEDGPERRGGMLVTGRYLEPRARGLE